VSDEETLALDAFSFSWEGKNAYAFPPFNLVGKIIQKYKNHSCLLTLTAFLVISTLASGSVEMSCGSSMTFALREELLTQPLSKVFNSKPEILYLAHGGYPELTSYEKIFCGGCQPY